MSFLPLKDQPAELIKAHILDPENSPLPEQYRDMLNRAVSMYKTLDKHPVAKMQLNITERFFLKFQLLLHTGIYSLPGRCLIIFRILTLISG